MYSFGKINHDTLLWAVALCLAFTDWGVPYALVPDRRINVATCFHLANDLLLNIPFQFQVLTYLPFVAFARSFGRPNDGVRATNAAFSWRVPVIICAIILGAAHTAQRLKGGGSQFLFVEGDSLVSITVYVSLVLLALCPVVIAIDLTTAPALVNIRSASE